jgi:hypothetical protein
MTAMLQAITALMGGILNSILTYEAYGDQQKAWRIVTSGATALGLFGLAAFRFGLLGS